MTLEEMVGTSARPDLPLAVVVGAGGLGQAIARRRGQRDRLFLPERDGAHLGRLAQELNAAGHDVSTITCDVTSADDVALLAKRAAELGPIRTIAHVVGLSPSMGDW